MGMNRRYTLGAWASLVQGHGVRSPSISAVLVVLAATAAYAEGSLPDLPRTITTVTYVRPGSMPDKIGIMRGDILLKLNGRPIQKRCDSADAPRGTNIVTLMRSSGAGAAILAFLRDGEPSEVQVPTKAKGDDWEIRVAFVENIIPAVNVGRGITERQASLVADSVHRAAKQDWLGAIGSGEQAVRMGLKVAALFAHLGECWNHIPHYDKAEEWCRRALKLSPDNAAASRALAYALTFSGRPREAVALLEKLGGLRELDRNDGRVLKIARSQLQWVKPAATDDRRRKAGILPDLLDPRNRRREVSVRDLVTRFWPTIWPMKKRGAYAHTPWTDYVISNASLSAYLRGADVYRLSSYFKRAGFWFTQEEDAFFFGLCPNGDANIMNGETVCRIPGLACVVPGMNNNAVRIVRQGCRFDCYVNGTHVLAFLQADGPARLGWTAYGMKITFDEMKLEVPVPAGSRRGMEEPDEEVF